jgi:putative ABC transport system permease protein
MIEQIAQFMSALKAASWTYALIGIFGLILAAVGLAGVTAYSVTQRRHEIGIRMALGARAADVLGLVMKEGVTLVTVGTVVGLAFAWAGIRALSGMFFSVASVQGNDPVLLVGAPLLLAGLALIACYVPARKSMRVDPAVALRQE